MRTHTFHIFTKRWFPPEDPIAILVAKLCILREDYLLELAGMIQGGKFNLASKPTYGEYKVGLDENSESWRRMYFFRNSIKTLYEVKEAVEAYASDKNPKLTSALVKESKRFRNALKELRKNLTVAEKAVERIRHNLGGHVSLGEIKKTLRNMPDDGKSLFQYSDIAGKLRYKFTGDIVVRMLLPDVPEDQQLDKLDELLKETRRLIPVFRAIDEVFAAYAHDRNLTA